MFKKLKIFELDEKALAKILILIFIYGLMLNVVFNVFGLDMAIANVIGLGLVYYFIMEELPILASKLRG